MPTLVAEALIGLTFGTGISIAAIYVVSYAIVIGAYYAYGTYQAKAARDKARAQFNDSLKDRLVMTATTDAPRSRVYGECRNVDGILFKNTHGAKSEFYTFVTAIAGHEIDSVRGVYFNDTLLTLDGSGYVQTAPFIVTNRLSDSIDSNPSGGAGSVTLPHPYVAGSIAVAQSFGYGPADTTVALVAFSVAGSVVSYTGATDGTPVTATYGYETITPKARVRSYLGAPGQDLSTDLIALGVPDVTTAHKFAGIACLLVTLEYDQEAFAQGVPQISAVMRGAKIFDPRTSTTAWSRNPALIARDWAIYQYGGGAQASEIVDSLLNVSANICDVVQTFVGDAGNLTGPTYLCDLVAPTLTDPTQTMNEIVSCMAGKYAWCGGLLRIKAGGYTTPVIDIDETFLSGAESIDITAGVARNDLVNIYRPSIADASQAYVLTPTEPVRAAAYISADGLELPRDITFLGITDTFHAQHVSNCMLKDSRQALTVKLPCNLKAYPIEVFDVVTVTIARFGWAAKAFEILSWNFAPTGGVVLTMKETAASIWDPLALFTSSDAAPNTALPLPWVVPTPTGLAVTSGTTLLTDGSVIGRALVSWDPTTVESVRQSGFFELQYTPAFEPIPAGDWQNIRVAGDASSVVLPGLITNTAYLFRLREVNSIGIRGQWCVQVLAIIARAPTIVPDWTDVVGRPILFHATTFGRLVAGTCGLYDETGTLISLATPRSYLVCVIRRSDGVLTGAQVFDVYGAGALTAGQGAAQMAALLNSITSAYIVVVISVNEPQGLRTTFGLDVAMYRCGASRAVFGSPMFKFGSAYILIGIAGCGEGNGFESYQGAIDDDPAAFCDVGFMLKGGNLIVTGAGATPRTLHDYSYEGTLDATTDISLIARGNCVLAGNLGSKLGGSNAWDSDVYSRDSAFGACLASAIPAQANGNVMFGLNSDPTTDQSYTSLDYAWYLTAGATATVYESGVNAGGTFAYASGDVFVILYDGSRVLYLQNGVVRRTVAAAPGLVLFLDSSFYTPGAALHNIRFGPLSANDWASIGNVNVTTPQINPGAATEVYVTAPGSAVPVTNQAHTPDGFAFNTLLRSITFTPGASGTAQVFFDGRGNYTNSGGTMADASWSIQDAGATYQDRRLLDAPIPVGAGVLLFSMGTTRSFPVTVGVPMTIGVYAHKLNSGDTFVVDNLEMRIEIVKR